MTQGDSQTPEIKSPKKNKFIIIAIILLVVTGAIVVFVVWQNKKNTEVVGTSTSATPAPATKKAYTEGEKLKILENLSVPGTTTHRTGATGYPLADTGGTTTTSIQVIKERMQILQNLSPDTTKPTLSDEEKLKILNSMNL